MLGSRGLFSGGHLDGEGKLVDPDASHEGEFELPHGGDDCVEINFCLKIGGVV